MLHRIERSLRVLLLAAGVLLLAWLPISFFVMSYVQVNHRSITVRNGHVFVTYIRSIEVEVSSFPLLEAEDVTTQASTHAIPVPKRGLFIPVIQLFQYGFLWNDLQMVRLLDALLPSFKRVPYSFDVVLPLWIPAVVFLAWPTTVFVARRRRRRRGFLVELGGGR